MISIRKFLALTTSLIQSFPRLDATSSRGYDGKIRFAADGKKLMHLATTDLTVAFRIGEVINPLERGHIAFQTDDITSFMSLLDSKGDHYSDYGTALAKEWHQVFFHHPEGNVIEVHEAVG